MRTEIEKTFLIAQKVTGNVVSTYISSVCKATFWKNKYNVCNMLMNEFALPFSVIGKTFSRNVAVALLTTAVHQAWR